MKDENPYNNPDTDLTAGIGSLFEKRPIDEEQYINRKDLLKDYDELTAGIGSLFGAACEDIEK